ncbi:hypothetical protein FQN49_002753 [Arthroderma sp. PD_2]|nr:hypothetical protein FQN49_002753 [Arthroderma sp. PD_2]
MEVSRQYPVGGDGRKKSLYPEVGWVRSPHILLVEDDQTCRQIGGKFLYSFSCVVDTAFDGLEAVNKIQGGSKYDLILMDIIMPNLDGVSACSLIRRFDNTPIIAMTSNIRSSDIDLYFHHGMNDVLPKPFTRQSLLSTLEKHLMPLKNVNVNVPSSGNPMDAPPQPQQQQATPSANNTPSAGPGPGTLSNSVPVAVAGLPPTTQAVKDETSPTHSPSTMGPGNWQNSPITPGQAGQSAFDANGMQYPQSQGAQNQNNQNQIKHRRQASDMAGLDVNSYSKRQRVYHGSGPGPGSGTGPGPGPGSSGHGATLVNPMQTSRMA